MSSQVSNNFDPAHHFFSHALVALADPFASSFADVRNASVGDIKIMKRISEDGKVDRLQQVHATLTGARDGITEIINGKTAISELRRSIEGLMNKAPIEPHADIFMDNQSDSSKEDDWENIGSDEEVIS